MCAKSPTSNKSNVLLSYSKQEKVSPWKTCTSLTIILLTMTLNNIRSWNQPRYVLTDDIVKEYFSEFHEYLPDFEICENPKEIVPALKGQRLQLDSLHPLLMCLIKRYKHDIKRHQNKNLLLFGIPSCKKKWLHTLYCLLVFR